MGQPTVVSTRVAVGGVPPVDRPTARRGPPGEVRAREFSTLVPGPGLALGTICQAVPSQCSASVWLAELPTAQTSELPMVLRPASVPVTDGLGTTVQAVPFQFSITGWEPESPTAQTSVLLITATELRLPALFTGCVTTLQAVPFQCSTRGWEPRE